jgi:ribonuclease HI
VDEKQSWIQTLEQIQQRYVDNPKVQQSVDFLKSVILDLPSRFVTTTRSSPKSSMIEDMPLPKEISSKEHIAVFSDGACVGNPGPGSWAAFAQDHEGNKIFESSSFDGNTTNNKMEMQGVINGLLQILDHADGAKQVFEVFVYTDSKYVVDGVNQWMPNWKKNGWKKADQKSPENLVLWQELDELLKHEGFIKVHLHWVKGHAGHPQNEYCDKMCQNLLKQVLG